MKEKTNPASKVLLKLKHEVKKKFPFLLPDTRWGHLPAIYVFLVLVPSSSGSSGDGRSVSLPIIYYCRHDPEQKPWRQYWTFNLSGKLDFFDENEKKAFALGAIEPENIGDAFATSAIYFQHIIRFIKFVFVGVRAWIWLNCHFRVKSMVRNANSNFRQTDQCWIFITNSICHRWQQYYILESHLFVSLFLFSRNSKRNRIYVAARSLLLRFTRHWAWLNVLFEIVQTNPSAMSVHAIVGQ